MESKQIRSSLIAKSMRFYGKFQPLHQEKLRVIERRRNQPKGFIQKLNSKPDSGFNVIPSKELCSVYLHKSGFLASKGVIGAQSKPPHYTISRFGRRFDQQKLKLKHHKEKSLRSFSPLGFGSDSKLRDREKWQYISLEKKPKEMKKLCDGPDGIGGNIFGQEKERDVKEVGSKLTVSTSREPKRVASDVKIRHISSSRFISKGENDESLECTGTSPGCQANSEEAHQPSPVSVLEPMFCEEDMSDDDEEAHLDFHGIEKQLDNLQSESESYSEGSGMEVSSDEESVLVSETKESKDSEPEFLDTEQNRDLSYIDDILFEAVLWDKNWVTEKHDLVMTSKIFEKLEKKYCTEISWKRTERRLFFDRVNSGLVEIVESFTATPTWKKSFSRRLGAVLSIHGLKQELCKVLNRQEKRVKQESLAEVPVRDIDEWLELEADDESVVCELECMIVDELLSEVVSFM
ncbi:unnamed protein product [Cochlearia groenlandica]